MPQKTVKGVDGRDYIELPGGVRFPADELKEPAMVSGGKIVSPDTGPRLNESPMHARFRGFKEGAGEAAYNLATPENAAALAAILGPETGGASLAIPPLVAAGTSMARNFAEGERDPKTMAGGALLHGGLNAVPGLVGRGVEGMMLAKGKGLAEMASHFLPSGTGRIARSMMTLMGRDAPQAAAAAAPGLTSDLAAMVMPSGVKMASSDGLKELVALSVKMENTPGTPPAMLAAVDKLIKRVEAHLNPANLKPGALLAKAGVQTTTAAEQAAQAVAAKTAAQTARAGKVGGRVRKGLHGALGATSSAIEAGR